MAQDSISASAEILGFFEPPCRQIGSDGGGISDLLVLLSKDPTLF